MAKNPTTTQDIDPPPKSQTLFKYAMYVCLLIIAVSVPGFIAFRQFCQLKGYHFYSFSALKVVLIGFIAYFIVKYSYYYVVKNYMGALVKDKYKGAERQQNAQTLKKLSFDFLFYSAISAYGFWEFRNQYWFPQILGGPGKCIQIYQDYPNWPSEKRQNMENYFCFQLGIHLFSLFELIIVRRSKERKYYEWMLHHVVAVALICLSLMINEIIIGIMILIVHDISDASLSSGRFFSGAKLPSFIKNKVTEAVIGIEVCFCWIFFRLIVYPGCLIQSVYEYIPTSSSEWYFIYWEYMILFIFTIILVFMHAYWLMYLIKGVISFVVKKEFVNSFDNHKQK